MTVLERQSSAVRDQADVALGHTADIRPSRRARRDAARVMRRLLRAAGTAVSDYTPDSPVFRKAVPTLAGGATGSGGVAFVSNLPPDRFSMDPAAFEQFTERQDIPQQQQTYTGFGSGLSVRLQNVGVIALIRLYFVGTLTVGGTGAVTALPGFPYTLFGGNGGGRVAFNANGQTSLISATGTGLRARRQRLFRNPAESIEATPAVGTIANGTYSVAFMVDVPVSHDMLTGIGWVLAQNPSTGLTLDIATAPQSSMFTVATGGTVALTGTLYTTLTTFAVGQQFQGDGRQVTIVPDLTVFHGIIENDSPFAASGVVQAPLIRTAGQLVNYAFNLNNGGAAEIAPSALTEIQFRYGGNRQPRVYNPPQMLLEKNQADYNGLVAIKGLTHTFLDFESDNPVRDLFVPEALVELTAQVTIPNSVTVNNGARFHYLEETLYPAV